MTRNQAVFAGAAVGLIVSAIVLILLWLGLGFGIAVGNINITNLLWPSSIMLIRGWRSTVPGVMITMSSVAINCILYAAIAFLLRAFIRLVTKPKVSRE